MGKIKTIEQGSVLSNPNKEPTIKTPEGTTVIHSWDVMVGDQNKGRITRERFTSSSTGKSKTKVFMVEGSRTRSIKTCLKKNGLAPVQEKR